MLRSLVGVVIVNLVLSILVSKDTIASESMSVDTLRMADVVRQVISHNDRVLASQYMEQAARLRIGPSGAWDDPMFMIGVVNLPTSLDFGEEGMTMKMIGLSQNIPYAGEKGLRSKAALSDAEAAGAQRQAIEVDLVVAAKSAYLDVFHRQLIVEDLRTQRLLAQDIVSAVSSLLKTDRATRTDVLAAQANLWRLDVDVIEAEQEVDASRRTLLNLMGRNSDETLSVLAKPDSPTLPESTDSWLSSARQHYPPLQQLLYRSKSYALSAESNRRMRWPTLNVSANYGVRSDSPTESRKDMLGFQATLSLPIFSGRQQKAVASSMETMRESLDAEVRQMIRDIEADLRTLHDHITRLSLIRQIYDERIVPTDEDTYSSAFTNYLAGKVSVVDLLTYARMIYRDRVMARQVALNLGRAWVEVERYTSNPGSWSTDTNEQK